MDLYLRPFGGFFIYFDNYPIYVFHFQEISYKTSFLDYLEAREQVNDIGSTNYMYFYDTWNQK